MKLGLLLIVVLAFVVGVSSAVGTASATKCVPGTAVLGGRYVQVYCGPARATLTVAGRTFTFRPGECFRSKDFTNVNIGTYTVGNFPVARFIRIVGPSRDGTTRKGTISWQLPGVLDGISGARLTLTAKGTRGSFSGRARSGMRASGSFTCR